MAPSTHRTGSPSSDLVNLDGNGGGAAADALQSTSRREIFDLIDKLREQGLGGYVPLPEIIVCGDQSAGKSSVLEAISGMSFPRNDTLCTRFATELVLRRGEATSPKVSIIPGAERTADGKRELAAWSRSLGRGQSEADGDGGAADWDLGSVVEEAKAAMGISPEKQFSSDILRVEICGPSQLHLTIVDLPGFYRAGTRDQSDGAIGIVQDMVLNYMRKPRSIILAVVSAGSDIQLQEVLAHVNVIDPIGTRTLGLVTKPDIPPVGSDSERSFVELVENQNIELKLGWHVLKNRRYEERHVTAAERDRIEAEFFERAIWARLDRSQLGIAALKVRLSAVLEDQIVKELPSLIADVEGFVELCQAKLDRLGMSRSTLAEQKHYLACLSRDFSELMKASVLGLWNHAYFGDARTEEGYNKRLRSAVQNTLTDYSREMGTKGSTRDIVEATPAKPKPNSRKISRDDFVDEVKDLMRRSRGRELPGTFNPLMVDELFKIHCKAWKDITERYIEAILRAVYTSINAILAEIATTDVTDGILHTVINPAMEALKKNLGEKVTELLDPHDRLHAITYNHYFTENVQKAQRGRQRRAMEKAMKSMFPGDFTTEVVVRPVDVLNNLVSATEPDMERYASSLAVDCMEAYYKVALKDVIDGISRLAVERCLISKLPELFSTETLFALSDADVRRLVGEKAKITSERERTAEKLRILQHGLREFRLLDKHQLSEPVRSHTLDAVISQEPPASDECLTEDSLTAEPGPGLVFNPFAPKPSAIEEVDASWLGIKLKPKDKKKKKGAVSSEEQP